MRSALFLGLSFDRAHTDEKAWSSLRRTGTQRRSTTREKYSMIRAIRTSITVANRKLVWTLGLFILLAGAKIPRE